MDEQNQDITIDEEKQKRNGLKKIFLIVTAVFIVAVVIFVILNFNQNKEIKQAERDILTYLKCTSLCPVNIYEDEFTGEKSRFYESSCYNYCLSYLKNKNIKPDTFDEIIHNKLNDSAQCIIGIVNISFDHQSCFNNLLNKNKDTIDLSDYKLPNYPVYKLSLINLTCEQNQARVKVKLDEGQGDIDIIYVLLNNEKASIFSQESIAPSLGEVKEDVISYPADKNLSEIAGISIFLRINNSNQNFMTAEQAVKRC